MSFDLACAGSGQPYVFDRLYGTVLAGADFGRWSDLVGRDADCPGLAYLPRPYPFDLVLACLRLGRADLGSRAQPAPEFLGPAARANLARNSDCGRPGFPCFELAPDPFLGDLQFGAAVAIERVTGHDPAICCFVRTLLQRSQVAPPYLLTVCFSSSRPCRFS